MTLYRALGPEEYELLVELKYASLPPWPQEQPMVYPLLTEEYAIEVTSDRNVHRSGVGYVVRFTVDDEFASGCEVCSVNGFAQQELRMSAEQMLEFHSHVTGKIDVRHKYERIA